MQWGRDTIEASVRITISKENYLKAIAEAESEGENVKPVTLSRWLQVSAPAVTMAIKRLKRDGLIQVHAGACITLTASGWEIANRLLYRHHLIERMLAEIFSLEWYKVHEEAEALEHAVSDDFERKLAEKLGSCCLCPHGNLVMDSPRERRGRGLKPLEEALGREYVRVASVFERDPAFLKYLDTKGIRPGVYVEVVAVGDEIALQADGTAIRLEREAGAKVWVSAA
jgi:DtxR family transcriptional regulator, Mn-dependent transcriptional regulator